MTVELDGRFIVGIDSPGGETPEGDANLNVWLVVVTASNVGRRPIGLRRMTFEPSDGADVDFAYSTELPVSLDAGYLAQEGIDRSSFPVTLGEGETRSWLYWGSRRTGSSDLLWTLSRCASTL